MRFLLTCNLLDLLSSINQSINQSVFLFVHKSIIIVLQRLSVRGVNCYHLLWTLGSQQTFVGFLARTPVTVNIWCMLYC